MHPTQWEQKELTTTTTSALQTAHKLAVGIYVSHNQELHCSMFMADSAQHARWKWIIRIMADFIHCSEGNKTAQSSAC